MSERFSVNPTVLLLWCSRPSRPSAPSLLTFLQHNTDIHSPIRTSSLVISAAIHQLIISFSVFHRMTVNVRDRLWLLLLLLLLLLLFSSSSSSSSSSPFIITVIKTNTTTVWARKTQFYVQHFWF